MSRKIPLVFVLIVLLALALACGQASNQPPVDQIAIQTMVSATESDFADQTAAAVPTATTDPYTIFAPDPLTVAYTGLIFEAGTCYDLDVLQSGDVMDSDRDLCMNRFGLLEPQNGGLMSGYATMVPPSKGECITPNLLPDPIAVQTDLYLCFQTNQGVYGFFVARE